MVGNAKWKPLEFLLSKKIVTQRQYHILQGTAGVNGANKNLKNTEWWGPLQPLTLTSGQYRGMDREE